jgi:hypothetical protein
MIIFEANNIIFCMLDNPKCGSSLLRQVIYPQIIKKYKIIFNNGNLTVHKSGYDNFRYTHCNLKGCINFLQKKNIDIKNVIFITTIRNPIKRVLSSYYFELKKKKLKYWKYNELYKDINDFLDWHHLQQFYPEKFRYYQNYKVTDLIKLENIQGDFNKLIKKYNLDIDTSGLTKVVNKTVYNNNEIIPNETLELIKTKYKLDFIDGNY